MWNTLTLHGLYETLHCVWSHTQSCTLLHEDRRDAVVHVHVVHRVWVQIQRVHKLSVETTLVMLAHLETKHSEDLALRCLLLTLKSRSCCLFLPWHLVAAWPFLHCGRKFVYWRWRHSYCRNNNSMWDKLLMKHSFMLTCRERRPHERPLAPAWRKCLVLSHWGLSDSRVRLWQAGHLKNYECFR